MANGQPVQGLLGSEIEPGFGGLLGDPLFSLGVGLLSAGFGRPQNFGQALGQGLQFMTAAQQQQTQNKILRARLANEAREQAAAERQQAAFQQIQGLLSPDPETGAMPAVNEQQLLGLLAQAAPDQFAQIALQRALPEPQQPTNLQREYEFLTSLNVPQERALEALRKGTVVNVGGPAEEPLKIDDLLKVRLPDGSTPPVGTTPSQAREMGAVVVSADEVKGFQQAEAAGGILDELEALAVGEGGIFTGVQPGFENRVASALNFALDTLTQGDPRASRFKDLSEGSISTFARLLGDKGALAEGDVARAIGLLPRIFPLPDTGEVAKDKIRQLRDILNKGIENLNRGIVVTPRAETPPAGGGGDTVPTYRIENGQLVPVK